MYLNKTEIERRKELSGIFGMAGLGFDQELPEYWARVRAQNEKEKVPHYSVLFKHPEIAREAFTSGNAYLFRDNNGNTFVTGYYDDNVLYKMPGKPDKKGKPTTDYISPASKYGKEIRDAMPSEILDKHKVIIPTNFKRLFDAGILFNGMPAARSMVWVNRREIGTNWVQDELKWQMENKVQTSSLPESKNYSMTAIEKAGKRYPHPIIYVLRHPDNLVSNDTVKHILTQVVLWVITKVVNFFTASAFSKEVGIAYEFLTKINNGEPITFKDAGIVAAAYGAKLLNENETIHKAFRDIGITTESVADYVKTGTNILDAIKTKDYKSAILDVGDLLQLDKISVAKEAMEFFKTGDIDNLSRAAGLDLHIIEKMVRGADTYKTIISAVYGIDKYLLKTKIIDNTLKIPELQTYLVNNFSNLANAKLIGKKELIDDAKMLTAMFPNGFNLLTGMFQTYVAPTAEEFQALVNLGQDKLDDLQLDDFANVALDACCEMAKDTKAKGQNFILPSQLPSNLQQVFANEIYERTGVTAYSSYRLDFP